MVEEIPPEVEELVKKAIEEAFVAAFRKVLDDALIQMASAMPRIEAARLTLTDREYVVRKP